MGLTFKENCPDIRNTKVVDIVNELKEYNIAVDVYDPWINKEEAEREYEISPVVTLSNDYDGIIIAVAHDQFKAMTAADIRALGNDVHVLYDLKYVLSAEESDIRL